MSTERILLIIIFIGLFFTTMIYGWKFVKGNLQILQKEGFTNPVATSNAPTRASDCRCLPGYIPSNTSKFPYEGTIKYFSYSNTGLDMYFINDLNKDYYLIKWQPGSNYFGLPGIYNNETRTMYNPITLEDQTVLKKYVFKGNLTQDKLVPNENNAYFCQSLSEPATTKSCY